MAAGAAQFSMARGARRPGYGHRPGRLRFCRYGDPVRAGAQGDRDPSREGARHGHRTRGRPARRDLSDHLHHRDAPRPRSHALSLAPLLERHHLPALLSERSLQPADRRHVDQRVQPAALVPQDRRAGVAATAGALGDVLGRPRLLRLLVPSLEAQFALPVGVPCGASLSGKDDVRHVVAVSSARTGDRQHRDADADAGAGRAHRLVAADHPGDERVRGAAALTIELDGTGRSTRCSSVRCSTLSITPPRSSTTTPTTPRSSAPGIFYLERASSGRRQRRRGFRAPISRRRCRPT